MRYGFLLIKTNHYKHQSIEKEILYTSGSYDQTISSEDLIEAQKVDITLKLIIDLKQKKLINEVERKKENPKTRPYVRQWSSLLVDNNVLYRKMLDEKPRQLVIPLRLQPFDNSKSIISFT